MKSAARQARHEQSDADASAANKRAATLLLRAFQEHPLLRIIAPGGAEGLSDSRLNPDSEAATRKQGESL